ncbi:hypothetical protein GCM10011594_42410 [Nakamurella endophytica]|uniref:Uncharacterized protein n=1 Tax=Nakamurella endophytica TaxID=1748367 RepID=A0A917TEJ9_9ACTN|nr:hypothetical protein GCM10011594_42410 [Nakamurella endophytica]
MFVPMIVVWILAIWGACALLVGVGAVVGVWAERHQRGLKLDAAVGRILACLDEPMDAAA